MNELEKLVETYMRTNMKAEVFSLRAKKLREGKISRNHSESSPIEESDPEIEGNSSEAIAPKTTRRKRRKNF